MGTGRRLSAAILLTLTVSACARVPNGDEYAQVYGEQVAREPGRTTLPPVGGCMSSESFRDIDCAEPHNVEVAATLTLTDPADAPFPGGDRLSEMAIPRCRAVLPDYLGSPHFDATRLQAWVFWPSSADWARGERWLLCSAIEIGADGESKRRTGALRGVLGTGGLHTYQTCTAGSPSRDDRLRTVDCAQPHVAEAVPDALPLGGPNDPLPTRDRMIAAARGHCGKALARYLKNSSRTDVRPAWRLPTAKSWAQGYTSVVCYAETSTAITGRLQGIGNRALPR